MNTEQDESPEDFLGISSDLFGEIENELAVLKFDRTDSLQNHVNANHGAIGISDGDDIEGQFESRLPSLQEIELIAFDAQPDKIIGDRTARHDQYYRLQHKR